MNKTILVLIASAFIVGAFAATAEEQWAEFKAKYGKNYLSEEENYRFAVFKTNLDRIDFYSKNDKGATYGVTQFADLTTAEFKTQFTGLNAKDTLALTEDRNEYVPTITDIPASWDWRDHGAVTPVKNQGQCGSCWAFSATQNIEGQYFIKHGQLPILAPQEIVDCDTIDQGCNGGLMEDAYQWLSTQAGLEAEADYPYQGQDGKCNLNSAKVVAHVTGYVNISTNETVIAQSLVELGPLSIGVDAEPWQFYLGGISDPWFCGGSLDHGVLLVGYGTGKTVLGKTKDFWIIKNSWGPSWGEKGYIRLVRGKGACGMNTDITCSTVA